MRYICSLIFLLPLVSGQCTLFSVGECSPNADEIIMSVDLPSDQGAHSLCQELCGIQEDCEYWSFDADTLRCTLHTYCYLHSCDSITGAADPDPFDGCICLNNGTCEDLVWENCTLEGTVVWEEGSVRDAHQCQDYLHTLGPAFGGTVFSYSHNEQVCRLLDQDTKTCTAMSGPRVPLVDSCPGKE